MIDWRITAAILTAVALGPCTAARAQDRAVLEGVFRRYDANSDERVVRTEFPGSDEQFVAMDKNRDGRVDFAEFEASPTARRILAARRRDDSAPRPRVDPARLTLERLEALASFDRNRDGRVHPQEWNGSAAAFAELDLDRSGYLDAGDRKLARKRIDPETDPEPPVFKSRLEGAEYLLERLDRNEDQLLSRREVRDHRVAAGFPFGDRDRDGELDLDELRRLIGAVNRGVDMRNRGSARPLAFRVPFNSWDKNGNGRLESNEWVSNKYLFARIDANRDAGVTPDEVERYVRAVEGSTFLERFDLNDDGRVTLVEFGGSPNAFRRADRNGDGVVSRGDR